MSSVMARSRPISRDVIEAQYAYWHKIWRHTEDDAERFTASDKMHYWKRLQSGARS